MDIFKVFKNGQQRMRKGPIRKWSDQEQRQLIDFLRNNLPIEKPTARLYYQRFSVQSNIAIEWRLVRSKVRNLRVLYTKSKYWQSSAEAMMLSEEDRRAVVLKMFLFFDDFEEISNNHGVPMRLNEVSGLCTLKSPEFPSHSTTELVSTRENLSSGIGDSDIDPAQFEQVSNFAETEMKLENLEEELSLPASTNKYENMFNETSDSSLGDATLRQEYHESCYKSSSIISNANIRELSRAMSHSESDEIKIGRQGMLDEREFRERQLALEIEKFNFEKEKFVKQHELRKWELESQERIRRLELQMQERIAMRDLHIKERVAIMQHERK